MTEHEQHTWSTGETIAAAVVIGVVLCPVGVAPALVAARWAHRHDHDVAALRRTVLHIAVATAVALVTTGPWYAWGWQHFLDALVRLHLEPELLVAIAAMIPIGVPAGLLAGIGLHVGWQHHKERHPLDGRAHRDKRAERHRNRRAAEVQQSDRVPITIAGLPVIGRWLDGDSPDGWEMLGWSVLPSSVAHLIALGATGGGKTESILRLAAAHLSLGWRVIVIDAKEEPNTARRFAAYASAADVAPERCRIWPESGPLDLCRGSAQAQRDRWMACAAWTEPYYRAVAASVLTLACEDPTGPPASPAELLERIDAKALKARWAGTDRATIAGGIDATNAQGVRYRYFSQIADLEAIGAISHTGGGWSWEDADAAWITLPTSTRLEVAGALGRAVLVDLIGYLRDPARRTDDRPILLVIEEMGAIVSADPSTALLVIEAVERARSAGVRCVISAQTPEGLGGPDAQARLLHGGAAILAHRMPNPEPIVSLLGTRMGHEASLGVQADGTLLDRGSLREQHQWQVSPDLIRRLPVGQALLAHAGYWTLTAVAQLPSPAAH